MSRSSTADWRGVICGVTLLWLIPLSASAQEVEIRRWNHLPIDTNFAAAAFGRTEADLAVDPVLQFEDLSLRLDSSLFGYIRTFELFDRTARVQIRQGLHAALWSGLVNGIPTSTSREGWSDTFTRFSVNLVGGPPLTGKAYADYRAAAHVETIVGAALAVELPTGQYRKDSLFNLGSNRFAFSPQVGVQQQYYNWSFEATGATWIHTENPSFFNGGRLQQDPFYTLDGNIEYKFQSDIWATVGAGIRVGGQSTVNGVKSDDRREDIAWTVSAGFPVTRSLSFRLAYLGTDHRAKVGVASQTFGAGLVGSW